MRNSPKVQIKVCYERQPDIEGDRRDFCVDLIQESVPRYGRQPDIEGDRLGVDNLICPLV